MDKGRSKEPFISYGLIQDHNVQPCSLCTAQFPAKREVLPEDMYIKGCHGGNRAGGNHKPMTSQIWLCFEGKTFTDKLNVGYERRKNQRYFQDFFRADVNLKKKGISTTDS